MTFAWVASSTVHVRSVPAITRESRCPAPEGVVVRQGVPCDVTVAAHGQGRRDGQRVAVLHVDEAAGDDLGGPVCDLARDLVVARIVVGGAVAVAVLRGERRQARRPVEARVVAEIDEQRGEVGGRLAELDARSTVGVPDSRMSPGNAPVVNVARPTFPIPTSAIISSSPTAMSLNVAAAPEAAGLRPSEPSGAGYSTTSRALVAGQSGSVIHCDGPTWTSARGSLMISLLTPCSQ